MKQEDLKTEVNNSPAKKSSALGNILLVLGIILVGANVCWYVFRKHQSDVVKAHAESLTRILDTASAHFEFGYGEINSSLYKTMKSAANLNNSNSFINSVLNNDIDQLLMTGHLDSNWTEIHSDNAFLKEYIIKRKMHKLKQREPGIICLIIKQVGKCKAEHVKLDYNYLTFNWGLEMYDPTDIAFGTNEILTPKDKKKYHVVQKQVDLGEMDTGSAKLIPLYIANWFDRLQGAADDQSTWNVTGGPMWVPSALRYLQQKSNVKIPLDEVLKRPIAISR